MRFPIRIFRVRSSSMEPTLSDGDYVIASAWHGRLREGDIVVLRHPSNGMPIVKRVKAVGNGRLFVVGDNWQYSEDSRTLGALGIGTVMGKVLFSAK
ncbi:MAG: nickel-type superoxide dismutase maturation protease [Candidatus Micrarchaeota archaeon]|nr:nickel-type superoxide dismutase maturation protease [Candidatus Micrarchaeota archaeon]